MIGLLTGPLPIFAVGQHRLQNVMRWAMRCDTGYDMRYAMRCPIVGAQRQLFVLTCCPFFDLFPRNFTQASSGYRQTLCKHYPNIT